ncbi:MAG: Fe-S cluster assembly protein SufD [Bacteroidetes bacterium]|nr:MAG: Fe-S cluster assembly protein SufD [Bacteroidota bacterium]
MDKFIEYLESEFEKIQTESEVRKQAFEDFKSAGFPTTKHEEWKYTNLKNVFQNSFDSHAKSDLTAEEIRSQLAIYQAVEANILVFLNGNYLPELSKIVSADKDLHIQNLSQPNEISQKHFAKYAPAHEAFVALNTAFANGLLLKISKNTVLEKPIIFHFLNDSTQANPLLQVRNLIVLEKSSQATIIENFVSIGQNLSLSNLVSEIIVEENAQLDHYKLQNEGENAIHVGTTQIEIAQNGKASNTTISLGGKMIRNNLNMVLNGENCEAYMNGLYMPNGNTHIDNHTAVDHAKPNSYSNELYKGVLADKSTGVFNGKIFVRKDAQKTNAFQSNKNILLSENASVNTKPQLEIWANDVKCSHGCTIGALDEEPLFYLQSRGIPKEKARKMLLFAFVGDVLDRLKSDFVRNLVNDSIEKKLA